MSENTAVLGHKRGEQVRRLNGYCDIINPAYFPEILRGIVNE